MHADHPRGDSGSVPSVKPEAAAIRVLAAAAAGTALAVLLALLRPPPVAIVAGLVLARYAVLAIFVAGRARLVRAEQAVEADPTRAELYFELAFARLRRGRVGEAVQAFRQGVGLDPGLDLDRPAELARCLLTRKNLTSARRKAMVYLITATLFDRMLEGIDDTLPAGLPGASQEGSWLSTVGSGGERGALSVRDVAERVTGGARGRFLEHCKELVESLRVEIAGLEQLLVALDGDESRPAAPGSEKAQQRRTLEREIERLRAHAGEIDSAIRHASRDGG